LNTLKPEPYEDLGLCFLFVSFSLDKQRKRKIERTSAIGEKVETPLLGDLKKLSLWCSADRTLLWSFTIHCVAANSADKDLILGEIITGFDGIQSFSI
jgi:hypothetical protein